MTEFKIQKAEGTSPRIKALLFIDIALMNNFNSTLTSLKLKFIICSDYQYPTNKYFNVFSFIILSPEINLEAFSGPNVSQFESPHSITLSFSTLQISEQYLISLNTYFRFLRKHSPSSLFLSFSLCLSALSSLSSVYLALSLQYFW